jgi:hypothetical protein
MKKPDIRRFVYCSRIVHGLCALCDPSRSKSVRLGLKVRRFAKATGMQNTSKSGALSAKRNLATLWKSRTGSCYCNCCRLSGKWLALAVAKFWLRLRLCTVTVSSYHHSSCLLRSTCSIMYANFLKSHPSPYAIESKDDEVEESLLPSEPQHVFPNHARASGTHAIVSHVATFILAVLFSSAMFSLFRPSSLAPASEPITKHLHCGNSTEEARTQGCVFDVLTNMWVPEPCWDKEGTEEYMRTAPWQGYDTQDAKRQLTLEEMSERVGHDRLAPDLTSPPYWTPLREHVIHCALMWQRQHRGFLSGKSKKLDFHSLSYQHTVHCSSSLVHMAGAGDEMPDPLDKIAIRTWVGFSECDIEV